MGGLYKALEFTFLDYSTIAENLVQRGVLHSIAIVLYLEKRSFVDPTVSLPAQMKTRQNLKMLFILYFAVKSEH